MGRRRKKKVLLTNPLFELPNDSWPEPEIKPLGHPVWTENKAKLIEAYLFLFVQITKHGTYIDGFSGPQKMGEPGTWAAKLVLEREPRWLRHFHLFEKKPKSLKSLYALRDAQPQLATRTITIYPGDFNVEVLKLLDSKSIGQKEATFALLDQRTFECEWETVRRLAEYKISPAYKIELFYFLPISWLDRAFSAIKNKQYVRNWWGRDDWEKLRGMRREERKELLINRFKNELHYKTVKAWPIYKRKNKGAVMYYMIHATDHPGAPNLMARAYEATVQPEKPVVQFNLFSDSPVRP